MKSITKLSLIAATAAVTGAALADDQRLQTQLALQRQAAARSETATTIAVYANDRGLGRSSAQSQRSEPRFELRASAHGQTYGAYAPAK